MPKKRPGAPSKFTQAIGLEYIKLFAAGMSIRQIAKRTGRTTETIKTYMSKASEQLLEDSKTLVIKELLPLAVEVYKAAMKQQIANGRADKDVDTKHADRIMKGMFIIDHMAQPASEATPGDANELPPTETLAAFMVQRPTKKISAPKVPAPETPSQVEETIEGEVTKSE